MSIFRRRIVGAINLLAGLLVTIILAIIIFLWLANWNQLRGPIGRYLSAKAHRHIEIDGDLKVHLLTWTPTVTVKGLKIGDPSWSGGGDMADVDTLIVSVRLPSLLAGKVIMPLVELDRPIVNLLRDRQGRANWETGAPTAGSKPLVLPPIQRFIINDGHLNFHDLKRRMTIDSKISSNESAGGAATHAFNLAGTGSLNDHPFSLFVSGGPLLNLQVNKPYAFSVNLSAAEAKIDASGHLVRPFDLNNFQMDLRLRGRDLADLYYVTGLALPNTPAYDVQGHLSHLGREYDFNQAKGRIGGSDISGALKVTLSDKNRPNLAANLSSKVLDFKDLAPLFGAPVQKGAKSGSSSAGPGTPPASADRRLLPDATLATDRLRGMDATLHYRASVVRAPGLPLRQATLDLTLLDGVLSVAPVSFSFPQGRLSADVKLDARGTSPITDLDARLSNVDLEEFAPRAANAPPPLEGSLLARVKLHAVGNSVHRAAAASNGTVTAVIPSGKIRSAFAELLGVNAGKGLSLLLARNQQQSNVRCAVADFTVENGVLQAQHVVFDTDVVKVTGAGSVNLDSETIDLKFKGDSKKFSFTHVFLPITVGGKLSSPKLGLQPAPALGQVGAAVALGVVLTPLAAVIPFIDPGLAKNADCVGLLAASPISKPSAVTTVHR